jgi:Pentapeptide repeats (8 copies)
MSKRWVDLLRNGRWLAGGIAALLLAVAVAWVLFVPGADWLARHDVGTVHGALLQTARDDARGRLLTLAAGLLAAGALLFTARNFVLSREGQVTDRYTKSVEQLGSDKLDVRIGGIYALERVARDSARDHPTVMEVLTAFIREHSREQWPPLDSGAREPERSTRPDVQAAVTVIGRRDAKRDIRRIDLLGADLPGATLVGADLTGAFLVGVTLTGADLVGATLTGATFDGADLRNARLNTAALSAAVFRNADLSGAFLFGVTLTGANLARASLIRANLTHANLTDAFLNGADLSGATLTRADLTGATLFDAKWPEGVPVPEGWRPDPGSGLLERASTDSGPTEAD